MNIEKMIEDPVFRKLLKQNGGTNELTTEFAKSIKQIRIIEKGLTSLKGIEFFSNLEYLECCYNQLREVDLTKNKKLKHISLYQNQLEKVKLGEKPEIMSLDFHGNKDLKEIQLRTNKEFESFLDKEQKLLIKPLKKKERGR